jgi:hypothetical protein
MLWNNTVLRRSWCNYHWNHHSTTFSITYNPCSLPIPAASNEEEAPASSSPEEEAPTSISQEEEKPSTQAPTTTT